MAEYENDDLTSVTRHHNRALRKVNKALRAAHKITQEYNDSLFIELCNSDANRNAELALRRLWEEGGFQPPCSPEDYDEIIDVSLRALKAYHDTADKPNQCQNPTGRG